MDIIQKVKSLNLPVGQYAVFGSAPMAIRKIRESHDIDMVVTEELYQHLKDHGWKDKVSNNGSKMLHKDEFEVGMSWEFGEYKPDVANLIQNADMFEGIPFVKLEEVLKWKKAWGRDKDQVDIKLIEEYMQMQNLDPGFNPG